MERMAALQVNGWLVGRWAAAWCAATRCVRRCGRRWVPTSGARCAAALVEQGKQDASSVDYAELGAHLVAAGDGARAAPLWKHALDVALACCDARAAPASRGKACRGPWR